jgi:hypothetical protein
MQENIANEISATIPITDKPIYDYNRG